ncbi:MAG TPA: hypothetical protein PKY77_02205 [Phycisphaerae bacterium]|nr:hypothetical protein [Phycisphaerae bacterium]HRY67899.1 hypothetical protein [Phycisphaerae bacterium]HSA26058.1 hypothetical protein [Phycisphaerae bacterium]
MRTLLVGPYVGEIGWELMSWQGRLRLQFEIGRFDRLIVLGAAGKEAFYEDMPLDYRPVVLDSIPGHAYEDRRILSSSGDPLPSVRLRSLVEPMVEVAASELQQAGHQVETLWPAYSGAIHPCDEEHQRFIRFDRPCERVLPPPWVVLVRRTRGFGAENWTAGDWDDLAGRLNSRGIHTSVFPDDSATAIEVLSRCDLAVGQSTGGLHLASLCGCPHLVWSTDDGRLWTPWEMTNRQRYETYWNPLGTPVIYQGSRCLPRPAVAAAWIGDALGRIGRRTGSAVRRVILRQRWRVRSHIVGGIIRRRGFRRWPWRVQKLVRSRWI